ncbi:MAG: hypothetical protein ABEI97_05015, partial [Candidatus Nanohaloarchaea archaeon]
AIWSLHYSVPPKTGNPFFHAFSIRNGILAPFLTLFEAVRRWLSLVITTPLAEYVAFWQEVLGFYFGRIAAFLTVPLFLLPAVGVLRGDTDDTELRRTVSLYAWFAGTFFLLGVLIFALYHEQGLSPVRGHPFLVIPFTLLIARGAQLLSDYDRRLLLVPAVFVVVSLAHVLPVAAATPVYLDVSDSPVSQFRNDVFLDTDLGERKIWLQTDVDPGDYYTLNYSDTIICGDVPVGAWLFCYPDHPVGYSDSIDWRAATNFAISRAGPAATVYTSVAGPFLYYAGTVEGDVYDLRCNVDHRSCNLLQDLQSSGTVWIVADDERYSWQLSARERTVVEENCTQWRRGNIQIFRCPEPG